MHSQKHSWKKRLGFDSALISAIFARVWGIGGGLITAILIAAHFPPQLQGYYYTFASLMALQVVFELGLGQVIIQFASHEWGRLHWNEKGNISGDETALSRLICLGRFSFRWYAVAGLFLGVTVGIVGIVFFSHPNPSEVQWLGPWLAMCGVATLNFTLIPCWALLEGCNQIAEVYRYRAIQGVLASLSAWISIMLGLELWTGAVIGTANLMTTIAFPGRRYRNVWSQMRTSSTGAIIPWRQELWPMQWRIAVSWLAGYFSFSIFTPILFQFRGPEEAGRMGMTLTIVSALQSVSMLWISTKIPLMGIMISRREYAALDQIVWKSGAIGLTMGCLGAGITEITVLGLHRWDHPFATRLLSPLPMGLFLLGMLAMLIAYPMAVYLRAHKREPLLGVSVINATLLVISSLVFGHYYGAIGMGTGYLIVMALVALPGTALVFYRCRTKWHSPIPSSPL